MAQEDATETERDNAWRAEYRTLKTEKLLVEKQLAEERLRALRRKAPDENDWSSAFLYSQRVKEWTGAVALWEQWGVYASLLGGALYCGNAYLKAYHVIWLCESIYVSTRSQSLRR